MQCTRQADENSTATRGTTYGYCATYPQCVGNASSSTIVKKTQRSYTAPTKTNSGDTYYTTPGKVTDVKIACDGSTISVDESAEDQCDEIPDTNSICQANKVLKACKRKGDENSTEKAETTYNLCTNGTSIFGTISDNDPCGGDTTSDAAKKKVKNIQYEYVSGSGSETKVGYTKKTTIMCNQSESNKEEYIYDTCIAVGAPASCDDGSGRYYKCYNQTKLISSDVNEREYNVCNPKDEASTVALADCVKAQSVFEIWQEDQDDDGECQVLFDKDCSDLTTSDMLLDLSAQGNWARTEYGKDDTLSHADLSAEKFQESLKPCKSFDISEDTSYSGTDGKRYTMNCVQ
jgi:hypothetical protein